MSLLLLLPTMPAAGPAGQKWSRWDVGCCCGVVELCGCNIVDNYEDDFASGTVDAGWSDDDPTVVEIIDEELVLHQADETVPMSLSRCIVLPDMTDKMVSVAFVYLAEASAITNLRIQAMIELMHQTTSTTCTTHATGHINVTSSGFFYSTGGLQSPMGTTSGAFSSSDPPFGVLFRLDLLREEASPGVWQYRGNWYADGILLSSITRPVYQDDEIAKLFLRWGTGEDPGAVFPTGPMVIDDVLFGVYDV